MYKVFIVDDEPIILSGISHLVNWPRLDCQIAGSFRNGREALNAIEHSGADIVITDIKMPVMDGLELVRACSEKYPQIVFIILTSLEEFRLVKEAIRYSVSEYIVKTELDAETLSRVIGKVKKESDRRKKVYNMISSGSNEASSLEELLSNIMLMRTIDDSLASRLEGRGLLDSYAFIAFFFQYPDSSFEKSWTREDYIRLYEWQKDVVEKILPSVFPSVVSIRPPASRYCCLLYFIRHEDKSVFRASLSRLSDKVRRASALVTGLEPQLASTQLCTGAGQLAECRSQLEAEGVKAYLGRGDYRLEALELDSMYPRLEQSVIEKDAGAVDTCLTLISSTLSKKDHSLSSANFILSAVESAVKSALSAIGLSPEKFEKDFFSLAPFISSRDKVIALLADIDSELCSLLRGITGGAGSQIIDKAREYIINHVDEKITLTDVASFAAVSPGYLSKSFKKVMGRSMIDYINALKVERAKEIMNRGSVRINEIALSLGYENVYYFSKVFRKITGVSPTDYMKGRQEEA